MQQFLLSFIPIFVAMDVLGILPMYIGFTEHLKKKEKNRIVRQSVITAFVVGITFLLLGKWIFMILGVMVFDFKIAGGLVLLAIALRDLLQNRKPVKLAADTMGAVPIGTPLVTGPAVLTTMVILLDSYGMPLTVTSFVVNLAIVWVAFTFADSILKILGKAGSKALSKIAHLLLAAIAVMMMRKGVIDAVIYFMPK
ncbi:MAG: MarC family protein [Candidatus Omnitrophota bacterium]